MDDLRFPADRATLATILRERGWRTGAFVSAFPLDSRFGLDRGFEVYDDRLGGTETTAAFAMPERPGTETVRSALRWLETVRGQRWFAFVHLYEPHFPYEAALELDDRVARAHYGLGVIAAGEGRTAEAIARRDYQTLFNLGTTLRGAGREAESRGTWRPTCASPRSPSRAGTWRACAPGSGAP